MANFESWTSPVQTGTPTLTWNH